MSARRPGEVAGAARRLGGDRGQVGGIEALPFGLLVFVAGTLLLANVWGVVDAKLATDRAAREAARTYVEATDPTTAEELARRAALEAIAADGRQPGRARIETRGTQHHQRCARAHFVVTYRVPLVSVPLVGGVGPGTFTVRSHHTELVDPYRSGVAGEAEGCGR